jgi:hypothetical protein
VLRYFCYFKESVTDRREENFRVRKCTIYYYLEDGSIHIGEPKQDNSGITQASAAEVCKKAARRFKDKTSSLHACCMDSLCLLLKALALGSPSMTIDGYKRRCNFGLRSL